MQQIKKQGKNQSNIMMDKSKSKRFLQKINIKFNDVMGMQKAK